MTVTLVAFAVPAFSLLWLNHVREQVLTAQLRATGERLRQVETDRERLQWVVAEVLNMTGKVSVQVPLDRCIRSQVLDERIRWTEGDDGRGVVGAILGAATAQLGGRASDESITSTNMVGTLATGLSVVGSSVPVAARVASVVGGERIRETRRPVNAAETVAVATAPVTVAKSPKAAARRSDAAGVRREEIVAGVAMPDSPQDGISPIAVAAAEVRKWAWNVT